MSHKHYPLTKEGIKQNIATGETGCYALFFASFPYKHYIGSSKDIRSRLHAHRRKLESRKHKNTYLQGLFNRYPHECRWAQIFEGTEREARDFEQLQIDFNMHRLYNLDNRVVNYRRNK